MCVAGALVCAGIVSGQLAAYQFPASHIGLFAGDERHLACIELEFTETPRVIEGVGYRQLPARQVGSATATAVKTRQGWEKASGTVVFSMTQAEPRMVAGAKIRVVGMLERLSPPMNPGEFDWERYYRHQGVLAAIRVNHPYDVEILSPGTNPALAAARVGVRDWLALGFSGDQQGDRAFLQALMLGDRGPDVRDVERDFQKTGTSHLLASSGVRMGVLAGLVYFVCRVIRLRPRRAALIMALFVVGWGFITLPTPQALRPAIVAGILALRLIGRRTIDPVQILLSSALVILLVNPLDIYGAGFQFSFIIVLGMLLLTRPFMNWFYRFRDPDQMVLDRFRHPTPWQQARRWMIHELLRAFTAATVAWIVSIPLVAYHFEQFTPWVVPISILLSPLVFAALGLGFLKLLASMLIPSMAPTWATIASWPVALLRWCMAHFAHFPGADIPVPAPPVWLMVLFYVSMCLPLIPVSRWSLKWGTRCAPVGACAMLLLMPWLLGFARQSTSGNTVRVTLLSIGAGQCAVVEVPGRPPIMVDAGSSTMIDPLHGCVAPFLHHEGRLSIGTIYLSHGDFDHISATATAWTECGVSEVITSPHFRKHAEESVPCRRLLEMLDQNGHPPREVIAGQIFDWGEGVAAEVLWPPKQCTMNSNNAGMVLRLTVGTRSILFPADIQDAAMRELLREPGKLKSDVLVAAHHGSSEPLTARFVRAVDPQIIVSSDATRLSKKQRDFEQIIEHRPLYRTSRCGAIEIDMARNGKVAVKPFLQRKRHGTIIERDGVVHEDDE